MCVFMMWQYYISLLHLFDFGPMDCA